MFDKLYSYSTFERIFSETRSISDLLPILWKTVTLKRFTGNRVHRIFIIILETDKYRHRKLRILAITLSHIVST